MLLKFLINPSGNPFYSILNQVYAWFLLSRMLVCVHVCCVCMCHRLFISSGVLWHDIGP